MTAAPTENKGECAYATRFHELFRGAEKRHLTYDPARLRLVDSKMEMKDENEDGPLDCKGPPTVELWEKHLAGVRPLGISPLREDGLCRWGVIDVDQYCNLEHGALAAMIARLGLPLVVCRSKSGGAHLYLFATDWTSQAVMNAALVAIAARLDQANAETYPPAPRKKGNCINMPNFGGDRSDRCGVKAGGMEMTVAELVATAEANRQSPESIAALAAKRATSADKEPASATTSARVLRKLTERAAEIATMSDGRKRALHDTAFLFGKYVLKGRIDEATMVGRLVAAGVEARLEHHIAESHVRNGLEARLRKRGQDDDDADDDGRFPEIEKIVIITGHDEPMWRVTVADYGDITLPSREVWKNDLFNLRCAERLRVGFKRLSVNAWADRLNVALRVAESEAAPRDESPEYVFRMALQDFCFDRHTADVLEEIMLGKPYHDDDNDRIWFRFGDLYTRLCLHPGSPFRGWSRNRLGGMLRAIGQDGVDVFTTTKRIGKKITEVRWVRRSLFDGPTDVPLPRLPAPEPI